jgi:hypothetical protein
MDQHLYDRLFEEFVKAIAAIIKQKGIKTAKELKEIVKRNINQVDLRLARVVMVNNARFGAFLDDAYESIGLATSIEIEE